MSEKTKQVSIIIDKGRKKIEKRKEFINTRNRYADTAIKLANEFDKFFIMLAGGIRIVAATFLANKEGGVRGKEILLLAFIFWLLGMIVFAASFYCSRECYQLRRKECDAAYSRNTSQQEELNRQCEIISSRLPLCKIISLICAFLSVLFIGILLYANIPAKIPCCFIS